MTQRRFDAKQEQEVTTAYAKGATLRQLAERFDCSTAAVSGVLKRREVEVRASGGQRKLTGRVLDEVVSRYQAGESLNALSQRFDCTAHAIRSALRFAGVERRASSWRPTRNFTTKQFAQIARRWEAGESQTRIARAIGCSQVTISRVLRERGEDPQKRLAKRTWNSQWKGGRVAAPGGYMAVLVEPDDPVAGPMRQRQGYVLEHRLVMARHLGRPLLPEETVHHKNGKRDDNRLSNLELWSSRHAKGQRVEDLRQFAKEILALYPD